MINSGTFSAYLHILMFIFHTVLGCILLFYSSASFCCLLVYSVTTKCFCFHSYSTVQYQKPQEFPSGKIIKFYLIFLTLLRLQHLGRCGSGCGIEASPPPAGSPEGSFRREEVQTLLRSQQPAALPAAGAPQIPLYPCCYRETNEDIYM